MMLHTRILRSKIDPIKAGSSPSRHPHTAWYVDLYQVDSKGYQTPPNKKLSHTAPPRQQSLIFNTFAWPWPFRQPALIKAPCNFPAPTRQTWRCAATYLTCGSTYLCASVGTKTTPVHPVSVNHPTRIECLTLSTDLVIYSIRLSDWAYSSVGQSHRLITGRSLVRVQVGPPQYPQEDAADAGFPLFDATYVTRTQTGPAALPPIFPS